MDRNLTKPNNATGSAVKLNFKVIMTQNIRTFLEGCMSGVAGGLTYVAKHSMSQSSSRDVVLGDHSDRRFLI
jgi:hypothetical protein